MKNETLAVNYRRYKYSCAVRMNSVSVVSVMFCSAVQNNHYKGVGCYQEYSKGCRIAIQATLSDWLDW